MQKEQHKHVKLCLEKSENVSFTIFEFEVSIDWQKEMRNQTNQTRPLSFQVAKVLGCKLACFLCPSREN